MKQKLSLLFLALSLCAAAQTVGLPKYGVLLSGTVQTPQLNNNSGKAVIGYVLRLLDSKGSGPVMEEMLFSRPEGEDSIPDGKSLTLKIDSPPSTTRIELDAVVFADGSVSGPDIGGSFEPLIRHTLTVKQAAKEFVNAQAHTVDWVAVRAAAAEMSPPHELHLSPEEREERYMRSVVASVLLNEKILHNDDEAAIGRAINYIALPTLVKK